MIWNTLTGQVLLGDIRFPAGKAIIKNVVQQYNGAVCSTTSSFDIGKQGKIKFISDLGGDKYLIEVVRNNADAATGDSYAKGDTQYCISKSKFETLFSEFKATNRRIAYGFLAVPFKLRFSPTTVAPGGESGGFMAGLSEIAVDICSPCRYW